MCEASSANEDDVSANGHDRPGDLTSKSSPVRMISRTGKSRHFPNPAAAIAYLRQKGAIDPRLI